MANVIDRFANAVSPAWALKRASARLQINAIATRQEFLAGYAAAEQTRLTRDYRIEEASADQQIIDSTPRLNARARAAVMNHWSATSIISAYRRHVVGTGIISRANARHPGTGKLLTGFNETMDQLYDRWACDKDRVDVEGRKTYRQIQSLGVSEFATVGQSFLVWSYVPRPDTVGLQLQVFETEQLAWDLFQAKGAGINEVKGGIEVNESGRAVAYWFHMGQHPLESWSDAPTRVPAERVHHLFRQERPMQTHGVTKLAPVLLKIHHLANYDLNHIVRARMEACIGAVITQSTDLGTPPPIAAKPASDDTNHPTDSTGNRRLQFQPGMAPELGPGEEIHFHNPTGPGANYDPFTRMQHIEIAAGADLDSPTMTRDFSKGTFSSQRQGLLERNAATDPIQNLVVDLWDRPMRRRFTTFAILEGRVEAPEFLTDPAWAEAYLQTAHQGPPKPWIDPLKQAQAAVLALAARLTTRRAQLNELGTNEIDLLRQVAEEERLAAELGVSLPEASGSVPVIKANGNTDEDDQNDNNDEDTDQVVAAAEMILNLYGGPGRGRMNGVSR